VLVDELFCRLIPSSLCTWVGLVGPAALPTVATSAGFLDNWSMWQLVSNKKRMCWVWCFTSLHPHVTALFLGQRDVGYSPVFSQMSRVLVSPGETVLLVLECAGCFYPAPFCSRPGWALLN